MRYLRTNTDTRITMGPFFDKTDGVTPEVAITVTACKLTFMVDTAGVPTLILDTAPTASGGNNDMVHVTNDDAGFYDLELTAANTNYLGRAMIAITDAATHCPVFHEFMILPAMIYDSVVLGTDVLNADVTQVGGDTQSATDLKDFADAGYDPATNKVEGVKLVDTTTTNTDMRGTNSAALASVCTETRLAELDGANLPTDVAAVKTDTVAILLDTGTDGVVVASAGAGLTAIPWNAAWDTEVQSECADALTAYAPSTHTAAGVWAVGTRVLTAGTNIVLAKGTGITGFNDIAAADVWAVATRTLTSFGTLVADIWAYATRKLTSAWTNETPSRDMAATMEGAYTITITVYKTATSTPIPNYDLYIYNSDESVYFGKVTTNSMGIATFARNNGTYKLKGFLSGYIAVNTVETVVVAGANVAQTIYASTVSVSLPGASGACTVYEYCFMPDGATPLSSVESKARIKKLPYDFSGRLYTGQEIDGIYDVNTGLVYWILVYGAEVNFTIKGVYPGNITKVIPSVTTKRLSEIT